MEKIRMKQSLAGEKVYPMGKIIEIEKAMADKFVEFGVAEYVDEKPAKVLRVEKEDPNKEPEKESEPIATVVKKPRGRRKKS